MTRGSFGSNATRWTLRGGRFRVMFVNVTPLGGPTVAASAFVLTNTWVPRATTTLFPLARATDGLPENAPRLRHVPPAFWLCHRFWLPLTYTIPAVLGSVVTGAR